MMRAIPADRYGHTHFQCPRCPANGHKSPRNDPGDPSMQNRNEDTRRRFRRLLQSAASASTLQFPESMIEDLPEEARRLLRRNQAASLPGIGPNLSEDLAKALRDQGYVIDEDTRGLRISGHPSHHDGGNGMMSPYDVLRMAADLEGGLQKPGERRRCSNCDAVLPKDHIQCNWCGTHLE